MKNEITTLATPADFERHAASVAAGFAALSPQPPHRTFSPSVKMMEDGHPAEPQEESADQIVIRESGLVGKYELRWQLQADIEKLTADLLIKKERSALIDLSAACDRLAAEVHKANDIPVNAGKVALAWSAKHPGEIVSQDLIETASHGEELKRFAKSTAKIAAGIFFDEQCLPAIKGVFAKAADRLKDVIVERVKTERDAFERFPEIYHDGDSTPYTPSTGLLRLMSRRRALLDSEILRTSPPSVAASLQGIFKISQPQG
jgi:hypothetical protein